MISKHIELQLLILSITYSVYIQELEVHLILGQCASLISKNIFDLSQIIIYTGCLYFSVEILAFTFFVDF